MSEQKKNNARNKVNQEVIELANQHKHLLLEHATAFGKSISALKIVSTIPSQEKTLIVVFERAHKQNFINEIVKFNYNPNDFVFSTYAGFSKMQNTIWKAIIFDEAHHFTEAKVAITYTIKSNNIILLSPKMPFKKLKLWQTILPNLYIDTKTIEDGIKLGILPIPKIKITYIELDNSIRDQMYIYKVGEVNKKITVTGFEEYLNIKNKFKTEVRVHATKQEYYNILCHEYNLLTEKIEEYEYVYSITKDLEYKKKASILKNVKLRIGSERKQFLANCKLSYSKLLFNSLIGKKLLFTSSIENANSFDYPVIHSKVKSKVVDELIHQFKNNAIKELVSVNMLRESHTIPNLKHVVVQQLSLSSILEFIQIMGRTLRNDICFLYLVIVKNTIDHEIVNKLTNINLINNDTITNN